MAACPGTRHGGDAGPAETEGCAKGENDEGLRTRDDEGPGTKDEGLLLLRSAVPRCRAQLLAPVRLGAPVAVGESARADPD